MTILPNMHRIQVQWPTKPAMGLKVVRHIHNSTLYNCMDHALAMHGQYNCGNCSDPVHYYKSGNHWPVFVTSSIMNQWRSDFIRTGRYHIDSNPWRSHRRPTSSFLDRVWIHKGSSGCLDSTMSTRESHGLRCWWRCWSSSAMYSIAKTQALLRSAHSRSHRN